MTITTTDRVVKRRDVGRPCVALAALLVLIACADTPARDTTGESTESWAVTAWGDRFEVFPEVDVLVAGQPAVAHTHVTRLTDFSPVVEARVEIVLAGADGEQVFGADRADRPGIFAIQIMPATTGEADLLFRIHDEEGSEEIAGGRVRIGTPEDPGRVIRAPAPRAGSDRGEALSFLKEQQWKSAFATTWVREGRLALSVPGLATLRPPAGGESTITAPIDGIVQAPRSSRWPYSGLRAERGSPLFRIVPLVAAQHSLAALEAERATLASELQTARARLERLNRLLELGATSEREVEESRLRVDTIEARHKAAAEDLETARSSRTGTSKAHGLDLEAPFTGQVASVTATPGATVSAGDALARLVVTDSAWVEVAVSPSDAQRLASDGLGGLVLDDPEGSAVRFEEGLSLVSIAPELSPRTGTVTVLLAAPGDTGLALGSTTDARILLAEERAGIVVPASALVDDGGVTVVYLQLAGESFARQRVRVLERQGDRVLVADLVPGQRLVARGGDAIRRSSLMSTGEAQGHVH